MTIHRFISDNRFLILILLLGSFLRFYHLDFQSIWVDEIHTLKEADPGLSWEEFHSVIMFREGIPHLYFILVKGFLLIFGKTIWAARMLSAIVGIASIYGMYLLGKQAFNKKAGLASAALLSVNAFHIFHSQDARSYALLLFFTVYAIYFLLKFIKAPGLKSAVWFAVFTGLIGHAHPIGITVICGICLFLLYNIWQSPKSDRLVLLKWSLISGVIAFVIFLPVFLILLKVSDINSFWVPMPTPHVYTDMVYEFLGGSELTWFIMQLLLVFLFVQLFFEKKEVADDKVASNKPLFPIFMLCLCWVLLAFIIPLVRSYLKVPMLLSRYFINLIPALLLLVGVGIALIRNNFLQKIIVGLLIFLSLVDLFVVKNYYNKVVKSEFKEVAEVIIKSDSDAKIVSSFGWLMDYFFLKDSNSIPTVEIGLNDYVRGMQQNQVRLESFWYMDGNERDYSLEPELEQFLDTHFILAQNIKKHDAWARQYIAKVKMEKSDEILLQSFSPFNQDSFGNLMLFSAGNYESKPKILGAGKFALSVEGSSFPEQPIQGENAQLVVKLSNGEVLGKITLDASPKKSKHTFNFELKKSSQIGIIFEFVNDLTVGDKDRNATISKVELKQLK